MKENQHESEEMDERDKKILYLEREIKSYQEREKKLEDRINRLKSQMNRMQQSGKMKEGTRVKGRPSLGMAKRQEIWNLRKKGNTIREIARLTGVSVGTVSNVIREYQNDTGKKTRTTKILYFMNKDTICTKIYVDFAEKKIDIKNVTDDILYRAFGCNENPSWADFEFFLEERCFPKTRDKMKWILKDLGLQSYDPWQIIQKTQGRMAEDYQWINFVEDEDDNT